MTMMEEALELLNRGDRDTARKILHKLADDDEDMRAVYYLAILDEELDTEKLFKAAESGKVPEAALHAAEHVPDTDTALRYLCMAAESGLQVAYYNMGMIYFKDNKIYDAMHCFQKAGEGGIAEGYYALGDCLFNRCEFEKSFKNFKLALTVNEKHCGALFNIACMLDQGRGCTQDTAEAEQRYEDVIRLGDQHHRSDAYCNLGRLQHTQGRIDECITSFRNSGSSTAKLNLACVYLHDKQDREKSIAILEDLAERGDKEAEKILKLCKEKEAIVTVQ